jgi:diguanylate cyclase (GGDEF)-like protein
MARGAARIVDVSEVQLRLAMVRAGIWLTYAVCSTGALYALVTWDQPHRTLIVSLLGVGMLGGLVIWLLPVERIVRSRFAEPFLVSWSVLDVALVAAIVAADGNVRSPYSAVFFLPLIFAALFYPLRSFVPVGALVVFAFVAGAASGDTHPDPTYVAIIATALASVAVMCAWQAQSHESNRTLLNVISRTDPLTNTLNRRGFEERLEAELAESVRTGQPLSLMLLDLDGFKAVNDRLGHAAGDELLCWVADRVGGAVRPMDSFGRLGGDEFAVLAPATSRSEAREIGERVQAELAPRIAATAGIAAFPEDGADMEELYRCADRELYATKHGGEGRPSGRRDMSWGRTLSVAVNTRMGAPAGDQSPIARRAAGLARRLGWGGSDLASLTLAAMVHDVGKLPVPDRILQKPGPLEEAEYAEVKRHLVRGAEMLGQIEGLEPIAPWLRHAHENFDGSGYPDGLEGEQIPLASRMLRVVTAFNAMTSDRPYRAAMTEEAALEQLRRNAGGQFDPRCVIAFEDYVIEELTLSAS